MSASMDISGNKTVNNMIIGVYDAGTFRNDGFSSPIPSVILLPCAYYNESRVFREANDLYLDWIAKGAYYQQSTHPTPTYISICDIDSNTELTGYISFSRTADINAPLYTDTVSLVFRLRNKTTGTFTNSGSGTVNRGYVFSGDLVDDSHDNNNFLYYALNTYSVPNTFTLNCGFAESENTYFSSNLRVSYFGTAWEVGATRNYYGQARGFNTAIINMSNYYTYSDLLSEPQTSTPQGGSGTYDTTSDPVPIPVLPSLGASNGGFITIYKPTSAQAQSFFSWLWSTDFEAMFNKLWYNPLDLIVGCYVSRISPTNIGGISEIKLAGHGTNINSDFVSNQYEFIDCGTLNISEFYGNFLDYQSEVKIYLPYIGERSIDINEFMAGSIQVKYALDFATGICIAFIYIVKGNLQAVLYQFSGNFLSQIPISSVDNRSIISSGISLALSGASVLAKPSASSVFGVVNSATNFLESKASVQHTGGLSGNSGYMAIQFPYLIFNRPIQSMSEGLLKDKGYMSNIYYKLGDLTGYTEVSHIDLNTIPCSSVEREEIRNLLNSGIYF